jgi:hypothetical protein
MSIVEKHDVFDETTLNDPILAQLTTRMADVQSVDLDPGALGPAQLPALGFSMTPGYTVCGGHDAIPVGLTEFHGYEDYESWCKEVVHPDDVLFYIPRYNYQYGGPSDHMRTAGPNPPYGAATVAAIGGGGGEGWSILARGNSSTAGECALINMTSLDLDVYPDLVSDRLEFNLSGYVKIGDVEGSGEAQGVGKPAFMLAFGVTVNNIEFILPRTISFWSNRTEAQICNLRRRVTRADILETIDTYFGAGQKSLTGFFFAHVVSQRHYDTGAKVALGNWGFSVDPTLRGDF